MQKRVQYNTSREIKGFSVFGVGRFSIYKKEVLKGKNAYRGIQESSHDKTRDCDQKRQIFGEGGVQF